MRTPSPPPKPAATYTLNVTLYRIAKARSGLNYDKTVAVALNVHPVTWSRIIAGRYPLVAEKAAAVTRLFPPAEYGDIVVGTIAQEVTEDAAAVPPE